MIKEGTSVYECALFYVNELRASVVPIHSAKGGTCTCSEGSNCPDAGKHPAIGEWRTYIHRLPTDSELALWFKGPSRNIAVIGGEVSNGLALIDCDNATTYRALCAVEPILKATATVETGKGFHLYVYPSEPIGTQKFLTGPVGNAVTHHIKAEGGYCVAPFSWHISGRQYRWRSESEVPLPMPVEALKAAIKRIGGRRAEPQPDIPREQGWAASLIRNGARKGERDEETVRLAGLLASGKIPSSAILALLEMWAERCDQTPQDPWGPRQIERKVQSVLRYRSISP